VLTPDCFVILPRRFRVEHGERTDQFLAIASAAALLEMLHLAFYSILFYFILLIMNT
jgi:hypothetical protein